MFIFHIKITIPRNILAAAHMDSAGDAPVQNARNRPATPIIARIAPRY